MQVASHGVWPQLMKALLNLRYGTPVSESLIETLGGLHVKEGGVAAPVTTMIYSRYCLLPDYLIEKKQSVSPGRIDIHETRADLEVRSCGQEMIG